ncbi:MAG TPA: DUF6513 domain-containing protein [Pirellulaceae bacterium]|jgi:dihydropteroate synthase|nr:DUF6513 domain-containing protein [Pirellulaceae bacterium]
MSELPHYLFVTGKLAESALRETLVPLGEKRGFRWQVEVLPITVAALMTVEWIAKRLVVPQGVQKVFLPGYVLGDEKLLELQFGLPVVKGPKDLRQLPAWFGAPVVKPDFGQHAIEIVAEINYAPRKSLEQILREAELYRQTGADVIDVGCEPGPVWTGVGDVIRALRDAGHRVSVDSLQIEEIELAAKAGAELVLSVNSWNREAAPDWGIEVVVIPDKPGEDERFDSTIEFLASRDVKMRLDPILEPIGFGFGESLARYRECRLRYPDAEILMGIGNLTELSDVDSAGINFLLLALCEEWRIGSVLTTQVVNWCRTSVRECDVARRLVHYAIRNRVPPKRLSEDLLLLRDAALAPVGSEGLDDLAASIRDANYRLFAEEGLIHLINRDVHLTGDDPFEVFEALQATAPKNLDPSHAFYLGYELAKAATALTLGKQYRQDEALDWGMLTQPETSHRARKSPLPEAFEKDVGKDGGAGTGG